MNIYLHVEIASRELDAKLLLGLVAAERGHDVVVGSIENMRTPLLKGWFPPGVFHTKDLCPTPNKIAFLKALKKRGFLIASQDEETDLVLDDHEQKILHSGRFGHESLALADLVFFFGERDYSCLAEMYPEFKEKFVVSGSPRIDLWQTTARQRHLAQRGQRYIGILSNFGFPFINDPLIGYIQQVQRDNEYIDSFEFWDSWASNMVGNVKPALELIRMVEYVARAMPDAQFIVRPHPGESVLAWESILGKRLTNVIVDKRGSTHDFLLGAQAIIHSGCTTGFEAYFSQVPCISYCLMPDEGGYRSASALVNRLGIITTNPAEVCAAINKLQSGMKSDEVVTSAVTTELGERVCSAGHLGGAERTVDAWEKMAMIGNGSCDSSYGGGWCKKAGALLAVREWKFLANRTLRNHESLKCVSEIKFPDLSKLEMCSKVEHIKERSGIASSVTAIRLDRQQFLLKNSNEIR